MKNYKLITALSLIVGATAMSVIVLTLLDSASYCDDCIARINSSEERDLNKFCYPSIYSNYVRTPNSNIDERVYPRTWLYAGNREMNVCLQVLDKPEGNIVSF